MFKPTPFPELLQRVARSASTPTYVYFERTIRRQIGHLRRALEGVPSRLLYAMKANDHPAILRIVLDEGVGIDAVSPAELLLALRMGFEKDQVLFSANNMTDSEMHFAFRQGVLLNIGELSRLERFGECYPGSDVCLRLNPQVGAGHHEHVITAGSKSKFGIPVSETEAIKKVIHRHDLKLRGLHQHIGSGIPDINTLWEAASVMLDTTKQFPGIEFVNFGGGLGIPYRASQSKLDLDQFSERFGSALKTFDQEHGVEVLFEPGRYFMAESGVLLVTATTIKENEDRCFVGVDSGMGHLIRPALYDSYHEINNLDNPDGPLKTYDIVGNICETGDRFAQDRQIPEIRVGDTLAILDVGAYGMSMASEYNLRPKPAEVLVPEDNPARHRVITERQTAAEMVTALMRRSSFPSS